MKSPLTVTYFQFMASLEEWVSRAVVFSNQSEILSMYARGYPVQEVGEYLEAKSA